MEAQRKRKAELQAQAEFGLSKLIQWNAIANDLQTSPALQEVANDAGASHYLRERLARVRGQIASLEERLQNLLVEGDPIEAASAIDRLCAAKAKLSEEERILAGRPLPGSHRPRSTSSPRRPSAADPLAE